jgi:polyphosphate kinase
MVVESLVKGLLYNLEVQWRRRLLPALRRSGIHIVDYKRMTAEERSEVDCHFCDVVRPLLSPLAYDTPRSLPQIASLGMNLLVTAVDRTGGEHCFILRVPEAVPSLVPFHLCAAPGSMPSGDGRPVHGYVWLDQVLLAHLPRLFPELRVAAAYRFRVLREVDVEMSPASADPIERVLEVLRLRRINPIVTLVADRRMPPKTLETLAQGLDVADSAIYQVGVVSDLRRLWEVTRIARADLRTPYFVPKKPAALEAHPNVLAAARTRDVLFHHPYESFQPVLEMIQQAADDPDVSRISMTLYRTDRESPIVQALVDAVRRGKQVRVIIELHARLDEHRNVNWWRTFEEAGAAVFAAPAGLKVHAKMTLIERHEGGGVKRYVHLSSGNYNAFTARAYTDLALLTCDEDISADIANLFDALCGNGGTSQFRALAVAPVTMRDTLANLVEREIDWRRGGDRGHIILKMNGLVDREVIQLLYRASQAGVDVDLLVRSICCLRPGLPGVSDRIRVRSIVGRFLEHSRVWYFRNGGHEEAYIGSADLMPRNLDRRIEVMAPVKDSGLRGRVVDILRTYLADNVKARELRADGRYIRVKPENGEPRVDAQLTLLREACVSYEAGDMRMSAGGRHRHLTLVHSSAGRESPAPE